MNPKTSIRAPKFEAMAPSSMSPGSPFGAQLKQRPETRVSGVETCRQAVATNRSMCACRFQALENNESGSLKHMEKSDRHSHEIYRCTKNYTRYAIYIYMHRYAIDSPWRVLFWILNGSPGFCFFENWPKDLAGTMFADAWGDGGVPWWRIWVTKKPGYFVV